jgi:hypothetical protein
MDEFNQSRRFVTDNLSSHVKLRVFTGPWNSVYRRLERSKSDRLLWVLRLRVYAKMPRLRESAIEARGNGFDATREEIRLR